MNTDRCEIAGCGCLVMGCMEDDGCPATRLCQRHYFLVKEICEPKALRSFGLKPSEIFGQPNYWEKEKLRQWNARYSTEEKLSGVVH